MSLRQPQQMIILTTQFFRVFAVQQLPSPTPPGRGATDTPSPPSLQSPPPRMKVDQS